MALLLFHAFPAKFRPFFYKKSGCDFYKKWHIPSYLARSGAVFFLAFLFSCQPRLPRILNENSGIARISADSLLWANDSGNRPTLYLTDHRGRLRDSIFFENEKNTDWEELARDPRDGRIFVGDFGNNSNARRDLRVLIFSPRTGRTEHLDFSWPDQADFPPKNFDDRNFDCESMVFWRDSLHFFTKSHYQGRSFVCKHFVVAAKPGWQSPVLLEKKVLKNRVVSGAALSQDGHSLALIGYLFGLRWHFLPFAKATIFTFENNGDGLFFSKKMSRQRAPGWPFSRQYESISFVGTRKVILSNEHLLWQKPRIRTVRLRKLEDAKNAK